MMTFAQYLRNKIDAADIAADPDYALSGGMGDDDLPVEAQVNVARHNFIRSRMEKPKIPSTIGRTIGQHVRGEA